MNKTDNAARNSKKQKKAEGIRLPARWLYRLFLWLCCLPIKLIFGVIINREPGLKKISGPLIILGNHPSYIDPFLAALALPWMEINFVAASLFFRNKRLRKMLKLLGVIPKTQFRSDAGALKQMLQVLKKKGAIGIFPEGQRSVDGTRSPVDDTIARLIKKTGCAVISLKISGAYLTWPRWSTCGFRPGRLEIEASLLLSSEQATALDQKEIIEIVMRSLEFNDYNWQLSRRKPASYLSFRPAESMHNICHHCPVCDRQLVMRSKRRKLYCSSCDAVWQINRHGFICSESESARAAIKLETVHTWRKWQISRLTDQLTDSEFALKYQTQTETAGISGAFAKDGSGIILLDHTGLHYEGKDAAGNVVSYFSPAGRTARFSADYGRNLEIPHDSGAFRFTPDDGQTVIMLADALALLDKPEFEQ